MAGEVSYWISLVALIASFVAYLEARKASKIDTAIEALSVVIDAFEKTQSMSFRES